MSIISSKDETRRALSLQRESRRQEKNRQRMAKQEDRVLRVIPKLAERAITKAVMFARLRFRQGDDPTCTVLFPRRMPRILYYGGPRNHRRLMALQEALANTPGGVRVELTGYSPIFGDESYDYYSGVEVTIVDETSPR